MNRKWSLVPLRLLIGFGFAAHGYAKLGRGPEAFGTILGAMGVPAPLFSAWATTLVELVGGVMIMAGVFILPLSIALAIIMSVAMFKVHLQYGFSSIKLQEFGPAGAQFGKPGYELNLLYIAGLLSLVLDRRSRSSSAALSSSRV